MTIAFVCPICKEKYSLKDTMAGRQIQCATCGHGFAVPASTGNPAAGVEPRQDQGQSGKAPKPGQRGSGESAQMRARFPRPANRDAAPPPVRQSTEKSEQPPVKPLRLVVKKEYAIQQRPSRGMLISIVSASVLIAGGLAAGGYYLFSNKSVPNVDGGTPFQPPITANSGVANLPQRGENDALFRRLLKSTVWIVDPKSGSSGTGVLIDRKKKLVLTCYHIVDQTESCVVFFPDYSKNGDPICEPSHYLKKYKEFARLSEDKKADERKKEGARLFSEGTVSSEMKDSGKDIALVQIDDEIPEDRLAIALARESSHQLQKVYCIGCSRVELKKNDDGALWAGIDGTVRTTAKREYQYSKQTVSAVILETNMASNPGDSGGPVVDVRGDLVGIISGGERNKQLVTLNIDVSEIDSFMTTYAQRKGFVWDRAGGGAPGVGRDLLSLKAALKDSSPANRIRALQALADMEKDAQGAIPNVILLLKDADPEVRREALVGLKRIGRPADVDVPLLYKALKDEDLETRRYAAHMFERHDLMNRDALENVITATEDKDPTVREYAIIALAKYHQGLPDTQAVIVKRYRAEQEHAVRKNVLESLRKIYDSDHYDLLDAKAICDFWIKIVSDRSSELRSCSGIFLSIFFAPKRQDVVTKVLALLEDENPEVRETTLDQLKKFNVLKRFSKEEARILIQAQATDKEGLPVSGFDSRSAERRRFTAEVASHFSPDNEKVLPDLARGLKDPDEAVRALCVESLSKFGKAAKPALTALTPILKDRNPELRRRVLETLGDIGHEPEVLGSLLASLADDDPDVRLSAENAMEKLAPLGKEDVPTLRAGLGHRNESVRAHAADWLGRIGAPASEAVPDLVNLTNKDAERHVGVRLRAATALGKIGPGARDAVTVLIEVVKERVPANGKRNSSPAAMTTGFTPEMLYERTLKSTVWILTSGAGTTVHSGSGAVVHIPERLVLTNYHVIKGSVAVSVFFPRRDEKTGELFKSTSDYLKNVGSSRINASVVWSDPRRDLALLQLSEIPKGVEALRLARSSARANETILSVGSSGVGEGVLWRSTPGKVRQVYRRTFPSEAGGQFNGMFMEATSPVNHGDSGGPVVNDRAELVAIVMAYQLNEQQVSHFIDVVEVSAFLKEAAKAKGLHLTDRTRDSREELRGGPDELRLAAVAALGQIGPDAKQAVNALGDLVRDRTIDMDTRAKAAVALGEIGPGAVGRVSDLLVFLAEQDTPHSQVVEAIAKLGPKAVDAICKRFFDRDRAVRLSAVRAIGNMGPLAKDAQGELFMARRIEQGRKKVDREMLNEITDAMRRIAIKE